MAERRPKHSSLERVLGTGALFSTAYGNVGSSIYYALGLVAVFALGLLAAYLASPIDLVPDFIPVAGQLDDAILVALVLRGVLRAAGEEVVRGHWRGPERSLRLLL